MGCRAQEHLLFHRPCPGPQPALPGQCHPSRVFLPQGPALGTQPTPQGALKPGCPHTPPPTHPRTYCVSKSPKTLPQRRLCFQVDAKGEAKRKMGERRGQHHPPPPLRTPTPQLTPQASAGPHVPLGFAATASSRSPVLSPPTSLLDQTLKGLQGQIQTPASTSKLQPFPKERMVGFGLPQGVGVSSHLLPEASKVSPPP